MPGRTSRTRPLECPVGRAGLTETYRSAVRSRDFESRRSATRSCFFAQLFRCAVVSLRGSRVHRTAPALVRDSMRRVPHVRGWRHSRRVAMGSVERKSGQGRGRTADTWIFSPVLYQLSYLSGAQPRGRCHQVAQAQHAKSLPRNCQCDGPPCKHSQGSAAAASAASEERAVALVLPRDDLAPRRQAR